MPDASASALPSNANSPAAAAGAARASQADAPPWKPPRKERRSSDGNVAAASASAGGFDGSTAKKVEAAQPLALDFRLLSALKGAAVAAFNWFVLSWKYVVFGFSAFVLFVGAVAFATASFCSQPDVQAIVRQDAVKGGGVLTPAVAAADSLSAGPSPAESALVAAALSEADALRREVEELHGTLNKLVQVELDRQKKALLTTTAAPHIAVPKTSGGADLASERKEHYDLVIVVPSAARELERRNAVRASWLNYLTAPSCKRCRESKIKVLFIVGNEGDVSASRAEAAEHGDLAVLEDFGQAKHYTLRSEKTLRCVRYAVQHFTFRLLLKTDTDSWVFLDRLLHLFDQQHLWDKEHLYAGNFRFGRNAKPETRPTDKWYDPVYLTVTGMTYYPQHAKGAGYVLGRRLAEALARVDVEDWQFLPSEDVATGFWAFPLKKDIVDIPVSVEASCDDGDVIDHYVTPERMKTRWNTYLSLGTPCFRQVAQEQRHNSRHSSRIRR